MLDVLREGSFVGFLLREGFLVLLLEGGVEVRDEELVIDILQYLFPSASCPLSLLTPRTNEESTISVAHSSFMMSLIS